MVAFVFHVKKESKHPHCHHTSHFPVNQWGLPVLRIIATAAALYHPGPAVGGTAKDPEKTWSETSLYQGWQKRQPLWCWCWCCGKPWGTEEPTSGGKQAYGDYNTSWWGNRWPTERKTERERAGAEEEEEEKALTSTKENSTVRFEQRRRRPHHPDAVEWENKNPVMELHSGSFFFFSLIRRFSFMSWMEKKQKGEGRGKDGREEKRGGEGGVSPFSFRCPGFSRCFVL